MSGTPVFHLAESGLAGNTVREVKGILNGTTNFILTKMETEGMDYGPALALAQKLGYAEADPTADVEGFDALAKVVILSNVLLGGSLKTTDVPCKGISSITKADVEAAKAQGFRYKLIGHAKSENGVVTASVSPQKLPLSDPLAGVMGAQNALSLETDLMGKITIQGAGAGKIETGFAILRTSWPSIAAIRIVLASPLAVSSAQRTEHLTRRPSSLYARAAVTTVSCRLP